ncbi:hypothetical protein GCM10022280_02310 [Sphingomonas swuensis]|uniref:J domain-containing protein n=1 Tax=Sphingomonas swuensis TaxID=977800 RepID=A0ABP7SAQ9_9SPHN
MQAAADYYAVLGVAPEAESGAIRMAYRNLMRRHHPDVNPSDDAAARATEINEAYDCLGDPDKRAAYDRQRSKGSEAPTFTAGASAAPRRSNWQPHHVYRPIEPDPLPKKWSRISLGLASVLTAVIFALTSATPPPIPLPPPPVTMVGIPPQAEPDPPRCEATEVAVGTKCVPSAPKR